MKTKKTICTILILTSLVMLLSGCAPKEKVQERPISNLSKPVEPVVDVSESEDSISTKEPTKEEIQAQIDFQNSIPENDTDIGLKTIKIDTAMSELTEQHVDVLRYFDEDYFSVNYEEMRRYPQVFENAEVVVGGVVTKVLSQNGNEYELLLATGINDISEVTHFLLRGTSGNRLYIEGDAISAYGTYFGIETISVDGVSMTIPSIKVHTAYMPEVESRFDYTLIKSVAKSIFGDDIEVQLTGDNIGADIPFSYTVKLDNQSVAKLSEFVFSCYRGEIMVIDQTAQDRWSPIERHIEFSGDLEHFHLVSYDQELDVYTIECYDQQLNKVWKREFEEVQAPRSEGLINRLYDFTKNCFYIVINGELFTINADTGEDVFAPTFVGGDKVSVNKLRDGILLSTHSKADTFMKIGLDGHMIWKTNTAHDLFNVISFQDLDDRIVIHALTEDGYYYYALDSETGAMIVEARKLQ